MLERVHLDYKSGLLQRGYNCLAVGTDKLALVASDVVDMYLVEAEIEEALDMLAVSIEAGRDEDAPFEVFRANQFGESSEVFRRADILFGGFDAAIGPFLHGLLGRFLVGCCPGDV